MVKKAVAGKRVDWHEALDFVAAGLKNQDIGVLAVASFHAGRVVPVREGWARPISACAISDFYQRQGAPWLGMPIVDLDKLDRVLVIGSFLRKESPLIAQKLSQRPARRHGSGRPCGC